MPDMFREFRRLLFSRRKSRGLLKMRTLRWWLKYAWGIKTGVLILVTAVILLAVTLGGYLFYRGEVNKISDRFMRLQVFGAGEILALEGGLHTSVEPEAARKIMEPFQGRFHVETRSPAGNALGGAEILLQFMHPDGTVFYGYTEKTNARGLLNLPLPYDEKFPPRVRFRVTATHGKKTEFCEGVLRVRSRDFLHSHGYHELPWEEVHRVFLERDDDAVREYEARFGPISADVPAANENASRVEPVSFLLNHERPVADSGVMVEILPEMMLATAGEPLKMKLSAEKNGVPVVVGVWSLDFLAGFRPCVLETRPREMEIPVPQEFQGILALTVHDYQKSPPELVGFQLFYRHPRGVLSISRGLDLTKTPFASVDEMLDAVYAGVQEKETQRKEGRGARVEFMPPELTAEGESAENTPGMENEPAAGEVPEAAKDDAAHEAQRDARRVHAISRILLAAADWKAGCWPVENPQETAFPPETFQKLESVMTEIITGTPAEAEAKTWEISGVRERLARAALNLQAEIYRQNARRTQPDADTQVRHWAQYPPLAHAPLVYDGMIPLQAAYRQDLQDFQQRVVRGMGGVACIILGLALALLMLVVMMSTLKIPVGRNTWLATLAVLVCAVLLAWGIFARSDLDADTRNVIFQTWMPGSGGNGNEE